MPCGKGPDVVGQELGPDGDAGPHPQQANPVPVPHGLLHVVKQAGDMAAVLLKAAARLGQHQPPPYAVKEQDAVIPLQLVNGQAHRRLGHVERLRRPGGVAAAGTDGQKNLDVPDGHVPPPPYIDFIIILI